MQEDQEIYRCGCNINDDNAYKGMEKAAKNFLKQTDANDKNSKIPLSTLLRGKGGKGV